MTPQQLWQQIFFDTLPQGNTLEAMEKAVGDLGILVQRPFYITHMQIKLIPFTELGNYVDMPLYAAAVFLHMSDDLPGWALFTLSRIEACTLVDWLLERPVGTTEDLDPLACSALAEMGNVMLASFLSQISQFSGVSVRPSPPSVVVDKLSNILEISAASLSVITDELLVIEVDVKNIENNLLLRTWILPDRFAFQFDSDAIQERSIEMIERFDE